MSTIRSKLPLWLQQKWSLPVIAGLSVLITVIIVKSQPEMKHNSQHEVAVPVSVIKVEQHSLRPAITGYGTVKPDLDLQAMAEVTGRVTYVHPELKKGAILTKDTVVVTIDDKDYQLALKQAQADLLAAEANLKEMELTIDNNKLELKLANEKLKVRQAELARLVKLRKSGTVSQSQLDQEKQTMLVQQQEVQKLENQRTTLPSELEVLKAKIAIANAKVEQSERDLARTNIVLPFTGRISTVEVEKDQYIAKGSKMFSAVGMDKITINAQFPIDQFGRFIAGLESKKLNFDKPGNIPVMSQLLEQLGLTATVEVAGESYKGWQAKVERFSDDLDAQSRTVGAIVSVQGSYNQIEPGVRPPLLEGMYMKVTLKGKPREFLALPRFAMHEQQVFKLGENSTLTRISIDNILLQDSLALVESNSQLTAGDQIIVSDVFPAVSGMKVEPIVDAKTSQAVMDWLERAK